MWSHLEDVYIFNNVVNSILIGHHKEIRFGETQQKFELRDPAVNNSVLIDHVRKLGAPH